ncbi:MAG: DNA-directed RNA polymerase subunit omega [Mariprofundaceae bacterium]
MARVTIEDCSQFYPNRFEMVLLASRRARQILGGMAPIGEVESSRPSVQALKEIGSGHVSWEVLFDLDEQERLRLEAVSADPEAD